jgi:hypothetical protein
MKKSKRFSFITGVVDLSVQKKCFIKKDMKSSQGKKLIREYETQFAATGDVVHWSTSYYITT